MKNSALGLVEVNGYVGAVEALDVALKSANVQVVGCEFVTAGIVTIKITGDVAAVKAAVEASEAAVNRLGTLITTHVIARVSDEVWKMLEENKKIKYLEDSNCVAEKESNIEKIDTDIEETSDNTVKLNEEDEDLEELKEKEVEVKSREELEEMRVQELRTLARQIEVTSMTRKQIKFSKKEELIEAILKQQNLTEGGK